MKTSSRVLLVLMPGIACAVAAISIVMLTKSNIKAASFLVNLQAPDDTPHTESLPINPACRQGERIVAIGLVEPPRGITAVGSPSGGIVARVLARPGKAVRKGDPLFELDQRTARATLAIRNSELAIARAHLSSRISEASEAEADVLNAQANLDEQRAALADALQLSAMATRLESSSHISKRETLRRHYLVKQMRAKVRQAQAALAKARNKLQAYSSFENGHLIRTERANIAKAVAEVEAAKIAVERLIVTAPHDGTVYQVNIRPGERAAVDSTALMMLGSASELNIKVDLDEADLSRFDSKINATASRRTPKAAEQDLSFVRIIPIVVPKKTLSGQPDEQLDTRVMQVIYRLHDKVFFPGEVVDVFIRTACDQRLSTAVDSSRNRSD